MKIAVTGAGALLGQGIIKSIRRSSLEAEIIALDPSPLAAGLYWADRRYLIPMAAGPAFMEGLGAVLEKEKPHFLIPGTDVELPLLAKQREDLEKNFNLHVVVSSPEVIATADDKYLTCRFLKEKGFLYPKNCLPGEEEGLLEKTGFPLIVKPRVGARAVGVHRVSSYEELAYSISRVKDPIIQECLGRDDEEYTAGVLVFGGRCEASIVMRRDLRDGNTYRAYVDHYEDYNREVCRLGEALRPFGPANFQFRVDEEGIKVFEINARFSGTTPFRALAGFNEVEAVIRKLYYGTPVKRPTIKPITVLRYWEEMILPDN